MSLKYIAYYRVSTEEQGLSGLGLESQREAVNSYIASTSGELVSEYSDIQSGAKSSRLGLNAAIEHAVDTNAIILVKKIDRLSRGGLAIAVELEKLGVSYIDVTSPTDNDLIKEIKLSLAKDERNKISQRTRDALTVIKSKLTGDGLYITREGKTITSLGTVENLGGAKAIANSVASRKRKAAMDPNNRRATALINAMVDSGSSFYAITKSLNESGFVTSRGNKFSQVQVKKLYNRSLISYG